MKAAILDAPGKLKVADVPDKEPNGKEVLIRVKCCGICGSDVKIFQGKWTIPLPRILGHEFSGEVISVGKEVEGFEVGDRVSVDPNEICGECEYCRTDRPNFCENMIDHGILVDGGFADLAICGEKAVYKLPDNVSYEEGSFLELMSCAVHAINQAEIKVGDTVAVFGGGPGGQILHQLARVAGASEVTMFTHSEEKLDLARKLGATRADNPKQVGLFSRKYNVVIDAVGSSLVFEQGLKMVEKNGRFVLFGQAPEGEIGKVDLFNFLMEEAKIIPSFINPYTMDQSVQILGNKQIDVESLISHEVGLSEVQRGFDININKEPGAVKILVRPN